MMCYASRRSIVSLRSQRNTRNCTKDVPYCPTGRLQPIDLITVDFLMYEAEKHAFVNCTCLIYCRSSLAADFSTPAAYGTVTYVSGVLFIVCKHGFPFRGPISRVNVNCYCSRTCVLFGTLIRGYDMPKRSLFSDRF
jgi:hypothetical protein